VKYTFIQEQRQRHTATALCSALNVSMSGYYDWVGRPLSSTARANQALVTKIRCYYKASRSTYGSPRIHKDLESEGERVSRQRVARLMRSARIQSKMAKKFVITTNSKNTKSPASDLLKRDFRTTGRKQIWVSDTTFIRTRQGWLYLATVNSFYPRSM
jgi:putative transposase